MSEINAAVFGIHELHLLKLKKQQNIPLQSLCNLSLWIYLNCRTDV